MMMSPLYIDLVPPVPFRTRVVDAQFYSDNESIIQVLLDEVAKKAQAATVPSKISLDWADELIELQKKNKLPVADANILAWSHFGVICAEFEKNTFKQIDSKTTYIIHCIMAAFALHRDPIETMIQSIAIDGGYYLARSGLSPAGLKEAVELIL